MFDGVRVTIIAAIARNGVVGRDGGLPWSLPADLRHFMRTTRGHTLVMGRRTWDSLPRPLPGRMHAVVTSRPGVPVEPGVVAAFASVADALAAAAEHERSRRQAGEAGGIEPSDANPHDAEIFIAGGEAIWREVWPIVDRAILSRIDADFEGDARFVEPPDGLFAETERRDISGDVPFVIVTLKRA